MRSELNRTDVRKTLTIYTCYYHTYRNLWRIRRYLPLSVAKCIAAAQVTSRLNYCNSLFHNIAIKDFTKLQLVQNCLARVVTHTKVSALASW